MTIKLTEEQEEGVALACIKRQQSDPNGYKKVIEALFGVLILPSGLGWT